MSWENSAFVFSMTAIGFSVFALVMLLIALLCELRGDTGGRDFFISLAIYFLYAISAFTILAVFAEAVGLILVD